MRKTSKKNIFLDVPNAFIRALKVNLGIDDRINKETLRTAKGAEETSNAIKAMKKMKKAFREGVQ